jgi:hypothetical protein
MKKQSRKQSKELRSILKVKRLEKKCDHCVTH